MPEMSLRSKHRYCYRVKLSAYVRAYKMMYESQNEEDEDEEDEEDEEEDHVDSYKDSKYHYHVDERQLLHRNVSSLLDSCLCKCQIDLPCWFLPFKVKKRLNFV